MKFVDLAMGEQFELDGEIYARTGPLVASHAESGKQRFMARYMVVKPLAPSSKAQAVAHPEMIPYGKVISALGEFEAHCQQVLAQLETELPAAKADLIRTQLNEAHQKLLSDLGSS